MADLHDKIKKQVEFYFSDSNYPRDKFLRSVAAQNEEGYIPLNTLLTFSRMKQLTDSLDTIKESLKDSTIVQLNADGSMLKRVAALPDEDTSTPRTIYAKGFPEDTGYSIEDVEAVFSQFGKILSVRIRKTKFEKKQKPSVFVEFSTEEEAKKAVAGKATHKDKELVVMMKDEYLEKKKQERRQRNEEKRSKRKADDTDGKTEEGEGEKSENNNNKKHKKNNEEKGSRISGTVVRVTGLGEKVTRENIKETIGKIGTIAFVDFQQNQKEGYIRFETGDIANKVIEEFTKSPQELGGSTPTLALLNAEEEKSYWDKVHSAREGQKKGGKGFKGKKQRRKRF